jgi:5-(carboxyamino)imidazole ribonucleotide mutase
LKQLNIEHELIVMSAHRNPEKVREFGKKARGQGTEVIIAAAGASAHLPGVLASWTTLPVIGVPLPTSELKGIDSLYSIVQMPSGVPVACVGIGTSGAKNAALLAAQILGLKHEAIRDTYAKYKEQMTGK